MNVEWLFANGDVGELTSSFVPGAEPPSGCAYVFEYLHIADATTEGVTIRKRYVPYDQSTPRAFVQDLDKEVCVVVSAESMPNLLRLDANGKTRLARISLDENDKPVLDPDGMLVAMELPDNNVIEPAGDMRVTSRGQGAADDLVEELGALLGIDVEGGAEEEGAVDAEASVGQGVREDADEQPGHETADAEPGTTDAGEDEDGWDEVLGSWDEEAADVEPGDDCEDDIGLDELWEHLEQGVGD